LYKNTQLKQFSNAAGCAKAKITIKKKVNKKPAAKKPAAKKPKGKKKVTKKPAAKKPKGKKKVTKKGKAKVKITIKKKVNKKPAAKKPKGKKKVTKKPAAKKPKGKTCKLSQDGRCGPSFGNTVCYRGQYCSKWSWCGAEALYKNTQQKQFSNGAGCAKVNVKKSTCKETKNGRCGSGYGYTVCHRGQYCSKWFWCGAKALYKNTQLKQFSNAAGCAKAKITIKKKVNKKPAAKKPAAKKPKGKKKVTKKPAAKKPKGKKKVTKKGKAKVKITIKKKVNKKPAAKKPKGKKKVTKKPAAKKPKGKKKVTVKVKTHKLNCHLSSGDCGPKHDDKICKVGYCVPTQGNGIC